MSTLARIACAADPQAYRVVFKPTGQQSVDKALRLSSQLAALQEKGPVSPFALILRAQEDVDRLRTVLRSEGYYQGRPVINIQGRGLEDPALQRLISGLPAGTPAEVQVSARLGPQFRIGEIRLEGDVPPGARKQLGLAPGAPAIAADVLAAGRRLEGALLDEGRALAHVAPPVAYENPARHTLDVSFVVEAGPVVDLGQIHVRGLKKVNEQFVRERLLVHPGERFDPASLERARKDILALAVFSSVTVRPAEALDASGRIPLTIDVQERPPRTLGLSVAYSTDLGGSVGANWSHRNLFGQAEQLNLSASLINLGGTATTGIGYNLSGQFIRPDFLQRDQSLEVRAGALKQSLEAYDQTAVLGGVYVNRKLAPQWTGSIGASAIRERITQQGITSYYTLLGTPVSLKYDSTGRADPLLDATHGMIASLIVTPTFSLADGGGTNSFFTIAQVNAAGYVDLGRFGPAGPGRSVLAMRGLVGVALGAQASDLPPDQRFYGGGSPTVRGFRYQSIGPLFPNGQPAGGTAIDAGSLEYRQRIGESWGAAAFVDAGQVSASGGPFQGPIEVGAGIGIRYYSAIGPLRFDVAVPLTTVPNNDPFQVYIGIGQAF